MKFSKHDYLMYLMLKTRLLSFYLMILTKQPLCVFKQRITCILELS